MSDYRNDLLLGICGKLQLQPSKYKLADEKYHKISDIIQSDKVFNSIELRMYPHGSFRLKTTVKPLHHNEYDLDFVVEIPAGFSMTPMDLYNHIYRILSKDGIHNNMVEKKNRCIRINYMNDFHLDIMPGQVYNKETNEIIVPDRNLKIWYHHSNPIGYAEWFENCAKTNIRKVLEGMMYEKAEPISDQEVVARLEPLRRAVQLVKRYRDVYCDKNKTEPVRSIVICTLMGNISSHYSDEIEIIDDFCSYVNYQIDSNEGRPFDVFNPVVKEVFTEKWKEDERNYLDFVNMMKDLTKDINLLKKMSFQTDIANHLKNMFGETITTEVIKEHANAISVARSDGILGVGSDGRLQVINEGGSVGVVKPNTFYG